MADNLTGANARGRYQNRCKGIMGGDKGTDRQAIDPEQLDEGANQQTGIRIAKKEPHKGSGNYGPGDHALNQNPVKADQTSQ